MQFQEKENWPKVTIAVAIAKATPFLEEFFDSIHALEYPKEKLSLFIYNNVSLISIQDSIPKTETNLF